MGLHANIGCHFSVSKNFSYSHCSLQVWVMRVRGVAWNLHIFMLSLPLLLFSWNVIYLLFTLHKRSIMLSCLVTHSHINRNGLDCTTAVRKKALDRCWFNLSICLCFWLDLFPVYASVLTFDDLHKDLSKFQLHYLAT